MGKRRDGCQADGDYGVEYVAHDYASCETRTRISIVVGRLLRGTRPLANANSMAWSRSLNGNGPPNPRPVHWWQVPGEHDGLPGILQDWPIAGLPTDGN